MKFGVPNQRPARKSELFPNTPVLTIGISGGKGTARSMTLNSKAVEVLGLADNDATVAFAFEGVDAVFITNGGQEGIPDEHKIRVTKGNPRKVSEKRTYTFISEKVFQLDNSIENHLELNKVENEDEVVFDAFELKLLSLESKEEEKAEEKTEIPSIDEAIADFEEEAVIPANTFSPEEAPVGNGNGEEGIN